MDWLIWRGTRCELCILAVGSYSVRTVGSGREVHARCGVRSALNYIERPFKFTRSLLPLPSSRLTHHGPMPPAHAALSERARSRGVQCSRTSLSCTPISTAIAAVVPSWMVTTLSTHSSPYMQLTQPQDGVVGLVSRLVSGTFVYPSADTACSLQSISEQPSSFAYVKTVGQMHLVRFWTLLNIRSAGKRIVLSASSLVSTPFISCSHTRQLMRLHPIYAATPHTSGLPAVQCILRCC